MDSLDDLLGDIAASTQPAAAAQPAYTEAPAPAPADNGSSSSGGGDGDDEAVEYEYVYEDEPAAAAPPMSRAEKMALESQRMADAAEEERLAGEREKQRSKMAEARRKAEEEKERVRAAAEAERVSNLKKQQQDAGALLSQWRAQQARIKASTPDTERRSGATSNVQGDDNDDGGGGGGGDDDAAAAAAAGSVPGSGSGSGSAASDAAAASSNTDDIYAKPYWSAFRPPKQATVPDVGDHPSDEADARNAQLKARLKQMADMLRLQNEKIAEYDGEITKVEKHGEECRKRYVSEQAQNAALQDKLQRLVELVRRERESGGGGGGVRRSMSE